MDGTHYENQRGALDKTYDKYLNRDPERTERVADHQSAGRVTSDDAEVATQ